MRPSRATQPHRKVKGAGRPPSPSLAAMQRGRTASGYNPQDIKRLAVKRANRKRRRLRK